MAAPGGAAIPMASPGPKADHAGLEADPAAPAPSSGAAMKAKAFAGFMAGANLAKRGIKAGIAKGGEMRAELHKSERYMALRSKLSDAFSTLPMGVQSFITNPSIDDILAHPEHLFHVAGMLSAINHPEKALFEAAISGSAAVALASQSAAASGAAPLQGAQALKMAAGAGSQGVMNKFVPAKGGAAEAMVQQSTSSMQASRAAGTPINFGAVAHSAVSQGVASHATGGVNLATNQAIKNFTGVNSNVKFSPQEVQAMAGAIKPEDMKMMMRLMNGLGGVPPK